MVGRGPPHQSERARFLPISVTCFRWTANAVAQVPKECVAMRVLPNVLGLDVANKQPVAMGMSEGKETILTSENKIIRNSCIVLPLGREAPECILKSALNVLKDRKQDDMIR